MAAIASNAGVLKPFSEGEDIDCFLERLEQYFTANTINAERQVATLLTMIDEKTYKVLKSIVHPMLPKQKKYAELETALKMRYKPRTSYYRKRTAFDRMRQEEGECVTKWYARVRQAAADCNFENVEERVKDKFVTGMKQGPVYERLCEEDVKKELKELIEIALNKESVLQERAQVNKITQRNQGGYKQATKRPNKEKSQMETEGLKCIHCGKGNHSFAKCKYKSYKCKICKKVGHLANVCKSKPTNIVDVHNSSNNNENLDIFNFSQYGNVDYISPIIFKCIINNVPIDMELDTGAAVSCIPEVIYKQKFSNIKINETHVELRTYNGEIIKPVGKIKACIQYQDTEIKGELFVVRNGSKTLLGRDLIKKFNFSNRNILAINTMEKGELDNLLHEFSEIFNSGLGVIKGEEIRLDLKENTKPIFHKPKPVPHAFKEKVDQEINKLEREGVLEKVETSKWGTPLVPVIKENGSLRLCANYKITINKYLEDINHPLPRIEDIFIALQGGERFTKLDLRNAFNHLLVDSDTGELLAWSTPKGIYKLKRLPYGTKPASAIFQAKMEKVLLGAKGVVNFIDDVLITGSNDLEHLDNLREVLKRFKRVGIRLNKSKCLFFQEEVKYLGHVISKEGLKKDKVKIEAILKAPPPINVSEVRSWIGMVNYYSKFVPHLSQTLKPIYGLLQKDKKFLWSEDCSSSFEKIKKEIVSDNILVHFNRDLPLRLSCDASQNGIGAVLSHIMPDGSDRPISFISRVYSKAEKGYSMIHKEALAIYWAVNKFYQYLIGMKFELESDHKPLQALFGENKSLPQMAAGRLQRWSIYLANFDYTFKYISGSTNVKADCMSRLPLNYENQGKSECDYINFVEQQNIIDLQTVRSETRKDSLLSSVYNMIRYGFTNMPQNDNLKAFFQRKSELYIDQNVIMWGYRVVIPKKLQLNLLKELHSTHEGVVKMKANARSYFWWPGLDSDIENFVKNCDVCMSARPEPPKSTVISWPKTNFPYERVHADFLGPIDNKMVLLIIDTYSKWPEAFIMKNLDSKLTVEKFRECFSRFGLPRFVVTDNAATFCSKEFSEFLSKNGIHHETSPPFHPATNGFAENAVRNFKSSLLKSLKDSNNYKVSFETLMNRYLFHYRNSIHITTGMTPSELMFQRKLKTRFDLLNNNKKNSNKMIVEGKRKEEFVEGDIVYCRDYRYPNKKKFVKARIDEVLGKRTYLCKTEDNLIWKRHVDQIIRASDNLFPNSIQSNFKNNDVSLSSPIQEYLPPIVTGNDNSVSLPSQENVPPIESTSCDTAMSDMANPVKSDVSKELVLTDVENKNVADETVVIRHSTRIRKPPQRLNL